MHVAALQFELRIPGAQSIKDKRAVLRPFVEALKKVASVSVAEIDHHDHWQRATVGVALVAPDGAQLARLIEKVKRFADQRIDLEVLECSAGYLEP